jgi:hypothetical protein
MMKNSGITVCWIAALALALPAALAAGERSQKPSEEPSPAAAAHEPAGTSVDGGTIVGATEPVGPQEPPGRSSEDVEPGRSPVDEPDADILGDPTVYGDALLRYMTVLPGTYVQGSVDALAGDGGYLNLRAIPGDHGQCSIALIFGFEVLNPAVVREFELTYRAQATKGPATVALITGAGRDPIPLACDQLGWEQRGVLNCKIPASVARGLPGAQRDLELFLMIEGRCSDIQTDDAVAISKVHLGPPPGDPMPPPPT